MIKYNKSLTKKLKQIYGPFLWRGLICHKPAEPLQGDSLLLTTKSPRISGLHLINPKSMKDGVDLGAFQLFLNPEPLIGKSSVLITRPLFLINISTQLK